MRILTNLEDPNWLQDKYDVYVVSDDEVVQRQPLDQFDLVIVDIDHSQGLYTSRAIREKNPLLPIIGVSRKFCGSDWSEHKATFIEQGGSYLLRWPLHERETVACIVEIKRRFRKMQSTILLFDQRLIINLCDRTIAYEGEIITFTPKEHKVFMDLADHYGSLRTKDNLMNALYSLEQDAASSKIVDVFLFKIRRKLNSLHPEMGKCVETVAGRGYLLVDPHKGE